MTVPTLHHRGENSDAIVRWLVPQRVIYMWSGSDVSPSVREWTHTQAIYLYHSCATPQIHLVIDLRDVSHRSSTTRKEQPALWHPRRGWCVTMGAIHAPMMRAIVNPVLRLLRMNIQDFSSEGPALAFLQRADSTLPDLQPYWDAIRRQAASKA